MPDIARDFRKCYTLATNFECGFDPVSKTGPFAVCLCSVHPFCYGNEEQQAYRSHKEILRTSHQPLFSPLGVRACG